MVVVVVGVRLGSLNPKPSSMAVHYCCPHMPERQFLSFCLIVTNQTNWHIMIVSEPAVMCDGTLLCMELGESRNDPSHSESVTKVMSAMAGHGKPLPPSCSHGSHVAV